MQKATLKKVSVYGLVITLAAIIRALAIHIFISPNNFASGGVTGVAIMIQYKTGINAGFFIFGINLPLLILAAIYINKSYAVKSAAATILSSLVLILLEQIKGFPQFIAGDERLLAAIAAGVLGGTSLALMLKINGSSGGTDIVASLIQKKHSSTSIAWFILMCDATVVLSSVFVYGSAESGLFGSLAPVLLSLTEIFVGSRVIEAITQGFKNALKFEIITEAPEELSKIIFEKLNRGVTCIDAKGMFSGKEKSLLICIVRKNQIASFRQILKEFGQNTFTYITRTSEVVGNGFPGQ